MRRQAGFTLVELMVVLVIIAILSALALPRMTRNRIANEGKEFGSGVAQQLQRARMDAVTSRLPMYVFVYSDRLELRSAKAGATAAAALIAPTTTDPLVRVINAKPRITIYDVTNNTTAPTANLSTSSGKQVVFSTLGVGFIGPTAPSTPTPVYVYVDNANLPIAHPDRRFRIDVAGLTGFVEMQNQW